ncbi:hypothetical protein FH972_009813 [Carpinus fangiana]|uniref:Uncharacterized protein n=1 Tax=Carpinus fangiana TaxID=176857 RepID=A0A660KN19_9ROSI|nr:hypothetical protein FH972_009813 [Carpinus fangiana]
MQPPPAMLAPLKKFWLTGRPWAESDLFSLRPLKAILLVYSLLPGVLLLQLPGTRFPLNIWEMMEIFQSHLSILSRRIKCTGKGKFLSSQEKQSALENEFFRLTS